MGDDGFVQRILVVTSRDDASATAAERHREFDPRIEVIRASSPLSAGAARNLGRTATNAALLLFVDADCWLESGGARALHRELESRSLDAVSACVRRDGGGAVARVRHALEFKEAEGRRAAPAHWLPPSTTMLCRASAFDAAGGFPDMFPGEDLVLSHRLRTLGHHVERSDGVSTWHQHPPGLVTMLRHQYRLGSTAAAARATSSMHGSLFVRFPLLAPLLLPARLMRVVRWYAAHDPAWVIAALPLLAVGLGAWTAGFARAAWGMRRGRAA